MRPRGAVMTRQTRRAFLKRGGALGLTSLIGLPSCEALFPSEPRVSLRRLSATCASDSAGEAAVAGTQGKITFAGAVIAPTPCRELAASLSTMSCSPDPRCRLAVEVSITTQPQEGSCVECIGRISYRGEIRYLDPGLYRVRIDHDGRVIARTQVEVTSLKGGS